MNDRLTADVVSGRLLRERNEIAAAILLVADGRFPEVVMANLPDCAFVAEELRADAARRCVRLVLIERSDGMGCDVRVTRA